MKTSFRRAIFMLPERPLLGGIVLGFISGLLSSIPGIFLLNPFFYICLALSAILPDFIGYAVGLSHPAIIFGFLYWIFIIRYRSASYKELPKIVLISILAWGFALNLGVYLVEPTSAEIDAALADWMTGPTIDQQRAGTIIGYLDDWAGPLCGGVGALILCLGLAVVGSNFRTTSFMLGSILVGIASGFFPAHWSAFPGGFDVGWALVFLTWQMGIFIQSAITVQDFSVSSLSELD